MQGRRVLVVGGAAGIGRATVRPLPGGGRLASRVLDRDAWTASTNRIAGP